jgi:hypothetical protein
MMEIALICHPSTPTDAVRGLTVTVRRDTGTLRVAFALDADPRALRIPEARAPRCASRLWEHTCFEAFLAAAGPAYHEFNFAPSGEWAAHAFLDYRDGGLLDDASLAPAITTRVRDDGLDLDAVVSLARLSPAYAHASLRLGLTAVIEARDGSLSYWALHHPAERPDFHHADGFALRVEPPGGAW